MFGRWCVHRLSGYYRAFAKFELVHCKSLWLLAGLLFRDLLHILKHTYEVRQYRSRETRHWVARTGARDTRAAVADDS